MHSTPKTSWFKSSHSAAHGDCVEVTHFPDSFRKSSYSATESHCVEVAHLPTPFRKSSHSGTSSNCVEVAHLPAPFRKSSYSQGEAACVEVADWATGAAIRDTKHRDLGALVFPANEWQAFLNAVKKRDL
ncbi:DUF397 domain-containing protein [Thermobifida alba]|uniref:DUF397 domain-containing protein n=1 Tax=Thermobifida alba TaxID=53522 RepID=A0ABY4KYM0_THEAE|nr:DUF397 domain-containing protein [Thermobifida alba]